MLLTTTSTIEGNVDIEYIGIITGEAVLGVNMFKDIQAQARDIIGGRVWSYEKEFATAREIALSELQAAATLLGANAVIGVSIDYDTLSSGSMLMVTATGTAVNYTKYAR